MKFTQVQKALAEAYKLLPPKLNSPEASLLVYAFGYQESSYEARQQIIKKDGKLVQAGPAVSWWQMEKGGGIAGVLRHEASKDMALAVCKARGVQPTSAAVWEAMRTDDVLGAAFARLLIYTNPHRLPKIGDSGAAWALYLNEWRPGKPKPDKWPTSYKVGMANI